MVFRLESQEFKNGGMIPKKFTCDGDDISPPLTWADPPAGTNSFALICDDPDAPMLTWSHWVVYLIPGDQMEFKEGLPTREVLERGIKQGINSWRRSGYGGPCPPGKSIHRYFFKLYALDQVLDLAPRLGKRELEMAMKGHVLAEAQLIGIYGR